MSVAVIFGGTGFIGLHFARHLLDEGGFGQVFLADIKPPAKHPAHQFVASELQSGKVVYVECDVRKPISIGILGPSIVPDLIANFAAIHREPGHESSEYYETNLPGAENVCNYADAVDCRTIIFTSSISPYGPSEATRNELSIPTPATAYGGSKLVAEWIHRSWLARANGRTANAAKSLLIARPGVVFGPGEGGNVSRLVKMISKGFFVYAGNEDTRKAGIYVKELCHAMLWASTRNRGTGNAVIFNMTMDPNPTMKDYVESIQEVLKQRAFVPSIPKWLLLGTARVVGTLASMLGLKSSINIVRVRKLIRSNHIEPYALLQSGYKYRFDLIAALTDWIGVMPSEWEKTTGADPLLQAAKQRTH